MHDLPKDLQNSLRSYRGSVHRNSGQEERQDLEKGHDYSYERHGESSENNSSMILHPIASRQRLNTNDAIAIAPKTRQDTADTAKKSLFSQPKIDDPDPASDRLDDDTNPLTPAHFYELMGMHPPQGPAKDPPRHIGIRHGLYDRIRDEFQYSQTKFRIYDVLVYAFLVIQVILSAVFIVIGGLQINNHVAVATLGAFSTVIAGSLALMKGQGLPMRLRQLRDQLSNIIFECEELYADVGAGRNVKFKDVVKVREDLLRVMEAARRNHPDAYNAGEGAMKTIDSQLPNVAKKAMK